MKKVHKGQLQEKEIWVSEPGAIVDGTYETIEGYMHMNKNGKYVLFLSEFEKEIDGKTVYTIIGGHQGKYDLTIKGKAKHIEATSYDKIKETEYFGGLTEQFNDIKEEVTEEFGDTSAK